MPSWLTVQKKPVSNRVKTAGLFPNPSNLYIINLAGIACLV